METTSDDSFQMKLFKQLNKDTSEGENVVYSPISLYILLSLLANGAIGDTQDELVTCLLPNNPSLNELNSLIEALQKQLNTLDCVSIATMFATNDQPYEDFKSICSRYNTEISKLTSVTDINDWASAKTNGMIRYVIDSIEKMSFVLINAVYFKGSWLNPFPKSKTYSSKFNSTTDANKCQMMVQSNIVSAIIDNSKYEAIELLYSESNDIRAAYIKPKHKSIDNFIEEMTNNKLTAILKELREVSYRMIIGVPKMNIEGAYQFIPSLEAIGLEYSFKDKKNMPNITEHFNGVGDIVQKCIIKVDEQGTEACAVSAMVGKKGKPRELLFDSSFIFIIFHKDYLEHFLFIAKVERP